MNTGWLPCTGIGDKKKQKLREYMKSAKGAYYIEETELKKIDFLKEEEKKCASDRQKGYCI